MSKKNNKQRDNSIYNASGFPVRSQTVSNRTSNFAGRNIADVNSRNTFERSISTNQSVRATSARTSNIKANNARNGNHTSSKVNSRSSQRSRRAPHKASNSWTSSHMNSESLQNRMDANAFGSFMQASDNINFNFPSNNNALWPEQPKNISNRPSPRKTASSSRSIPHRSHRSYNSSYSAHNLDIPQYPSSQQISSSYMYSRPSTGAPMRQRTQDTFQRNNNSRRPVNVKSRSQKAKKTKALNVFFLIFFLLIGLSGGLMVYMGNYMNNLYSMLGTEEDTYKEDFNGVDGTIDIEINPEDQQIAELSTVNTATNLSSDPMIQNILLLGTDKRENISSSDKGWRSDTIIILSIDKRHHNLKMTSILRDTYVSIPGYNNNRINSAYSRGGSNLVMKTIESNFGIKIDRYASVNFRKFLKIVDLIGGIDLEITEGEAREINSRAKVKPELSAGFVHLNGWQTLEYARIRKIGTDFARTSRQRKVLGLIIERFKGAKLSELNDILYQALPMISTNLSQNEILSLIGELPAILQYPLESMTIPADNTWRDKMVNGSEVLVVDMEDNRRILRQFIFDSGISKFYGNTYNGYTYGYGYGNGYGYGYYPAGLSDNKTDDNIDSN